MRQLREPEDKTKVESLLRGRVKMHRAMTKVLRIRPRKSQASRKTGYLLTTVERDVKRFGGF